MSKSVVLLGSTGSIGRQTLDVVERCGFTVAGLCAGRDIDRLEEQIRRFAPRVAAVADPDAARALQSRVADTPTRVLAGSQGVLETARLEADVTLNAIVGVAGLAPTLAALEKGRRLALANKESLVTAGPLVLDLARRTGAAIHPVDSEHAAIFHCLQAAPDGRTCRRILLTASGGPFFGRTAEQLRNVTREETLRHPNWSMGAKITVDSATMMNKGLEIMEASYLFAMPEERIDVVIHRESIIHSMVEFDDGAVIAQLSVPDMRIPIQYALTWPRRMPSPAAPLDLAAIGKLSFYEPDDDAFPLLPACREALRRGGLYPAALNGANEEAVAAFLRGEIGFTAISDLVLAVLQDDYARRLDSVEQVCEADRQVRQAVRRRLSGGN